MHRLSELHGVRIGQMLAPFTFSVDLGATHAHMAALCKNNVACASISPAMSVKVCVAQYISHRLGRVMLLQHSNSVVHDGH